MTAVTDGSPPQISKEIIEKTFLEFFNFAAEIVGKTKALEFALNSHQITEKFYGNLSLIKIDEDLTLTFVNEKLSDREILGFGLWMQKFIRELKDFMIGIGKVEPLNIVGQLKPVLESTGFFEYLSQAEKLEY